MAHFHTKKKRGRPYLYVREIARVDGKPKVISQVYIGSPERVRKLACGQGVEELRLKVEEWGSLFLAQQADKDIDLAGIVDSVIGQTERETGPTVGEYFLYCVWNRMIQSVSKRALAGWYKHTAVQQIRPVDLSELTSQRYWDKWDTVSAEELRQIGRKFFEKIWEIDRPTADCLLFDTTNYFTYLATDTKSNLAKRGHSKDGKPQLRQVGLALLVDRGSRIPLFYREYPGNMHDSKLFEALMDEMFGVIYNLKQTKDCLTVVIDKGMNSEDNVLWIDEHARVHFVTSYSPYFAEELAVIPLERFEPVDTEKNLRLEQENKSNERLLAHRTAGEFWGKERTVVITYNPATARKQAYTLDSKMEQVRQELLEMRAKVRERAAHWRCPEEITDRYIRLCERVHMPSNLYNLEFTQDKNSLLMSFRKDMYRIKRKQETFGKNIIVTDHSDWSTTVIVQAHLDRWQVEERFRQSKDDDLVSMRPVRHWTDSKIRCHLFSCVVALTYLRRLERKLSAAGISRTATDVMKEMRRLHSVLSFRNGARTPSRRIETPSKTQSEVLSALGYAVDDRGVLQVRQG
jgi:transposase